MCNSMYQRKALCWAMVVIPPNSHGQSLPPLQSKGKKCHHVFSFIWERESDFHLTHLYTHDFLDSNNLRPKLCILDVYLTVSRYLVVRQLTNLTEAWNYLYLHIAGAKGRDWVFKTQPHVNRVKHFNRVINSFCLLLLRSQNINFPRKRLWSNNVLFEKTLFLICWKITVNFIFSSNGFWCSKVNQLLSLCVYCIITVLLVDTKCTVCFTQSEITYKSTVIKVYCIFINKLFSKKLRFSYS